VHGLFVEPRLGLELRARAIACLGKPPIDAIAAATATGRRKIPLAMIRPVMMLVLDIARRDALAAVMQLMADARVIARIVAKRAWVMRPCGRSPPS
jgi:hypothetical protein